MDGLRRAAAMYASAVTLVLVVLTLVDGRLTAPELVARVLVVGLLALFAALVRLIGRGGPP